MNWSADIDHSKLESSFYATFSEPDNSDLGEMCQKLHQRTYSSTAISEYRRPFYPVQDDNIDFNIASPSTHADGSVGIPQRSVTNNLTQYDIQICESEIVKEKFVKSKYSASYQKIIQKSSEKNQVRNRKSSSHSEKIDCSKQDDIKKITNTKTWSVINLNVNNIASQKQSSISSKQFLYQQKSIQAMKLNNQGESREQKLITYQKCPIQKFEQKLKMVDRNFKKEKKAYNQQQCFGYCFLCQELFSIEKGYFINQYGRLSKVYQFKEHDKNMLVCPKCFSEHLKKIKSLNRFKQLEKQEKTGQNSIDNYKQLTQLNHNFRQKYQKDSTNHIDSQLVIDQIQKNKEIQYHKILQKQIKEQQEFRVEVEERKTRIKLQGANKSIQSEKIEESKNIIHNQIQKTKLCKKCMKIKIPQLTQQCQLCSLSFKKNSDFQKTLQKFNSKFKSKSKSNLKSFNQFVGQLKPADVGILIGVVGGLGYLISQNFFHTENQKNKQGTTQRITTTNNNIYNINIGLNLKQNDKIISSINLQNQKSQSEYPKNINDLSKFIKKFYLSE